MATEHAVDCSYELDQQLTITALHGAWDAFARANDAPELVAPAPLGRPLMMFLNDAVTVQLYEQLFARVAQHQRPITLPIRCDSPELRRYLDLTIAPTPTGFVVATVLTRIEPRPRMPLLAADPRPLGSLVMCGWCKRLDADGRWLEVEAAVDALRLFERRAQPLLQQGICGDCHARLLSLLEGTSTERN